MDNLILQLQSKNEVQVMKAIRDNESILSVQPIDVDPLMILHPAEQSLAFVAILSRRIGCVPRPGLMDLALNFARRFVPSKHSLFAKEMSRFANLIANLPANRLNASILIEAGVRYSRMLGSGIFFTCVHDLALLTCLEARTYEIALPMISLEITEFIEKDDTVSAKSFLMYCYFAGLICLRLRLFDKALMQFLSAMYVPGTVLSAIQIEAYKKAILVSLLKDGVLPAIPDVSIQIPSSFKQKKALSEKASLYLQFGKAFESMNFSSAKRIVTENIKEFEADDNSSLISVCLKSMVSFKIKQLSQVYLSLSISDIEKMIGNIALEFIEPIPLHQKLSNMISKGKISARLEKGILFFTDDMNDFATYEAKEIFVNIVQAQARLIERMSDFDRKLGLTPAYLASKLKPMRRPSVDSTGKNSE
jgi:hypothetical protein